MENQLQIFNNEKYGEIRISIINNEPYFMLADVCRVLEIKNSWDAKNRLNKHGVDTTEVIDNLGRTQQATFINESNLYKLTFTSRKKEAEKFTDWVTSEVLPLIRKHGYYSIVHQPSDGLKAKRLEIMERNARSREAKLWLELRNKSEIKEVKQISEIYATNTLAGKKLLELPKVEKLTYSAGEIATMLNTTANKIGRLANKHNLRTDKYGKYFYDKSKYSNKEVETFRYFECAIEEFKRLLAN